MAFPPTSRALQIPEQSISRPKSMDDEVLLSILDNNLREIASEVDPETLKNTLDAIVSQIRQIMFGTESGHRWSDIPPISLIDLVNCCNPVVNETPGGAIDCQNLDFTTMDEFVPGSLEVWLQGNKLVPSLHYVELPDNQGFRILISSSDPLKLNSAPRSTETLRVNYRRQVLL